MHILHALTACLCFEGGYRHRDKTENYIHIVCEKAPYERTPEKHAAGERLKNYIKGSLRHPHIAGCGNIGYGSINIKAERYGIYPNRL